MVSDSGFDVQGLGFRVYGAQLLGGVHECCLLQVAGHTLGSRHLFRVEDLRCRI